MSGTKLRLSEVVFLRLSAGDSEWLTELRWPADVLALMDDSRLLAAEAANAHRTLGSYASEFHPDEWASLRVWLKRALLKPSIGFPRLLPSGGRATRAFQTLIDVAQRRADLDTRLYTMLDEHELLLQRAAFRRLAEPLVQLIVANASTDFSTAIAKLDDTDLTHKDRRPLARTLWALLARSSHKSCPLAFAADTAVLRLHGGGATRLRIGRTPYLLVRPNQALANEIIRQLRPLEQYIADSTRGLHLNVAAGLDGQRLRTWRSTLHGTSVRESLTATRLPQVAVAVLDAILDTDPSLVPAALLTGPPLDIVRKLVDEGILVREDLVTPTDTDPWKTLAEAVADAAHHPSTELSQRVGDIERYGRRYARPRPIGSADIFDVVSVLAAVRELGHEVIGPGRIASASASVDTFRQVQGDVSGEDLNDIRHAVEQYFALGALAYPLTPTHRKRHAFVDFFRGKYGEDHPVHLESMLIHDWVFVDRTLSFLLDPGDSPIHTDSDLVWPEPAPGDNPYARFYRALQSAAASGQPSIDLAPVSTDLPLLGQCQEVMDAICRVGRGDGGRLDVFVESATFSGRLVARHLDAVSHLGPEASAAGEYYRLGRHEPGGGASRVASARILASHAVPHLQNLSPIALDGGPVLGLSEPIPAMPAEMLIKYGDLFVRFDSARQGFITTRGRNGPAFTFSWSSPLSPSFSRRLHLLRFLALAGEPVVTAPRWLRSEAGPGGHMPQLSVGRLVLSPQRWAIPIQAFASCQDATGARRHCAVRSVQQDHGLPAEAFVYTAGDTRPSFIDFESPFGVDVFLRLVRQAGRDGSRTVLVEERFPLPGREIVDSPSGSASLVFRCTLSPNSPAMKG